MPDLDAPRYAIPCLDAQGELTGRTLVCPDRKRIVTTECAPAIECDAGLPGSDADHDDAVYTASRVPGMSPGHYTSTLRYGPVYRCVL